MSGHTPGPWIQGKLLETALTKKWGHVQRESAEFHENREIYANFQCADEGRGRILIAVCNPNMDEWRNNARLIADAPKTKEERDDLLAAAKMALETMNYIPVFTRVYSAREAGKASIQRALEELKAAIAKAEGKE